MADGVDHIDIYADVGEEFNQVRAGAARPLLPSLSFFLPRPPYAAAPPAGPSARGLAAPRRHCSAAPPQGFPAAPQGAPRDGTARGRASGPARGDSGLDREGSAGARGRNKGVRERSGPRAGAFPPALLSLPRPSRQGERSVPGSSGECCHCLRRGRSGGGPSGRREERGLVPLGGLQPARAGRALRERRGLICARKWR